MSAVQVAVPAHMRGHLAGLLASLPDDFAAGTSTSTSSAEVVVVDGRQPEWPERLEEAQVSARAVLLREPCLPRGRATSALATALRELASRASTAGTPVVVQRRWSAAPGVVSFAATFAPEVSAGTTVAVLVVEDDPQRTGADSLLDALGLARAAGKPVTALHGRSHSLGAAGAVFGAASWTAWGAAADRSVAHLQGVHCAVGARASLTTNSAAAETSVLVPDAFSASPVLARCADAEGERLLPTDFEDAARHTWRRLHQLLQTPAHEAVDAAADLEALALDVDLLLAAPVLP